MLKWETKLRIISEEHFASPLSQVILKINVEILTIS